MGDGGVYGGRTLYSCPTYGAKYRINRTNPPSFPHLPQVGRWGILLIGALFADRSFQDFQHASAVDSNWLDNIILFTV